MNGHTKIICGCYLNLDKLPGDVNVGVIEMKPYLDHLLEEYGGSLAGGFEIVVEGDRRNESVENLQYYLSLKVPIQMNLKRLSRWLERIKNDDTQDKFLYLMKRFGQGNGKHEMLLKSIFYF